MLFAAAVVRALASGDHLYAVLFAAGTLYFGHIAGMSISMLRDPAQGGPLPRISRGLCFRYALAPYYWMLTVIVMSALGATVLAILQFRRGALVLGVLCAAPAAAIAIFVGVVVWLAPGRLVLTPAGVHHRSLTFDHFVPWEAVASVEALPSAQPMLVLRTHRSPRTRIRRYLGGLGTLEQEALPLVAVRAYWLRSNALRAYRAVDFYLKNAHRRPELDTEAPLHMFN